MTAVGADDAKTTKLRSSPGRADVLQGGERGEKSMSARGFSGGGRSLEEAQQRAATASSRVKLKKFLLRYYPPGIIL